MTTSLTSVPATVNPHAMLPLLPATIAGMPGRLTPVTLCGPQEIEARYQVLGTDRPKCMSFARSPAPEAVRAPATANEFEPGMSGGSPDGSIVPE